MKLKYVKQENALSTGSIEKFLSYCTPDYKCVGIGSRPENLALTRLALQRLCTLARGVKLRYTGLFLMPQKNEVMVRGKEILRGRILNSNGRRVPWKVEGEFMDVWIHTKKGWQKQLTRSLYAQTWVNGKLVRI